MYGTKCQNLILTLTLQKGFKGCVRYFSCLCWNSAKVRIATSVTSRVASFLTLAATILSTMLAMVMILLPNGIAQYVITVIVFLFLMVTLICLSRQPITDRNLRDMAPMLAQAAPEPFELVDTDPAGVLVQVAGELSDSGLLERSQRAFGAAYALTAAGRLRLEEHVRCKWMPALN